MFGIDVKKKIRKNELNGKKKPEKKQQLMFLKNKKCKSSCYQNKFTTTIMLVDFYRWKIMTTNGVCIDR